MKRIPASFPSAHHQAFTLIELPAVRECKRAAFTLIELMVVIAIIAILAGLLLPALGTAQESGRIAHCGNNLSQIGKGLQQFADAHKDYLPKMLSGPDAGSWANRIYEFVGSTNTFVCMSDPISHNPGDRTYSANGYGGTPGYDFPFSVKGNKDQPLRMSDFDNNQGDLILIGERPYDSSGTGRGTMNDENFASLDLRPGDVHRNGKASNYLMASMAVRFIKVSEAKNPTEGNKGNIWTLFPPITP